MRTTDHRGIQPAKKQGWLRSAAIVMTVAIVGMFAAPAALATIDGNSQTTWLTGFETTAESVTSTAETIVATPVISSVHVGIQSIAEVALPADVAEPVATTATIILALSAVALFALALTALAYKLRRRLEHVQFTSYFHRLHDQPGSGRTTDELIDPVIKTMIGSAELTPDEIHAMAEQLERTSPDDIGREAYELAVTNGQEVAIR